MKHLIIPLFLGSLALTGCGEGDRLTWSSVAAQFDSANHIETERSVDYHQGGGVTEAQIDNMKNYAPNQPSYAMRKLLGSPNQVSESSETYEIRGTGNDYQAPSRFTVQYRPSADCNYECSNATSWYREN